MMMLCTPTVGWLFLLFFFWMTGSLIQIRRKETTFVLRDSR